MQGVFPTACKAKPILCSRNACAAPSFETGKIMKTVYLGCSAAVRCICLRVKVLVLANPAHPPSSRFISCNAHPHFVQRSSSLSFVLCAVLSHILFLSSPSARFFFAVFDQDSGQLERPSVAHVLRSNRHVALGRKVRGCVCVCCISSRTCEKWSPILCQPWQLASLAEAL